MAQAMPANVEGGLALFVSALQGSLAAGSAVGGIVYDATGPGGALAVAAAVAAAGSLTLAGRAGASISSALAGPAGLARERGREAPTPPQGAIDGAGNSAPRTP
jgi:hypothetical protein